MKHTEYMQRCIELARKGAGRVAPNPMVGSVIVHNESIIGEGYHECYGEAHAEVNAISSVTDKVLLKQSTLYVNLEPCSHYGKTPPCADTIIAEGIPRVVIGAKDLNPEVSGRGISKLREAGIEVITDVLNSACKDLNKRFYTFHKEKRPYVILKWAQTADGFIAREDYSSKWISCEESRELVHKWRSEEAAIMVGTNTALYDNPQLTVRGIEGKNPIRIFIDQKRRVPTTHHLFDQSVETLMFTDTPESSASSVTGLKYSPKINSTLQTLYEHNIQSILLEGGAKLLQSFIDSKLWDEARVFTSDKTFSAGISAPVLSNTYQKDTISVSDDTLKFYQNSESSL